MHRLATGGIGIAVTLTAIDQPPIIITGTIIIGTSTSIRINMVPLRAGTGMGT